MAKENTLVEIFPVVIAFILLLSMGTANAQQCSNTNITLTNYTNSVCTSQWIKVITPVTLNNTVLESKGIIINNTFKLEGTSSLNASEVINFGSLTMEGTLLAGTELLNNGSIFLEKPIFINFTSFVNNGIIRDENFLNNGGTSKGYGAGLGGSFQFSYGGSGGASIQNDSANNGGNTLVQGGTADILCDEIYGNFCTHRTENTSGEHVTGAPSNFTFNLSLLDSAGGADFNAPENVITYGGSGVFPLVIISKFFDNAGKIYNQGQSINYSLIPNASAALNLTDGGVVGAGGGGIIEAISQYFEANGTMDTAGGKVFISRALNESLNGHYPFVYNLSDLGNGGNGNAFLFHATNALLAESLPNPVNPSPQVYVNQTNTTKIQDYLVETTLANPYSCGVGGIYLNATSGNNSTIYPWPSGSQDLSFGAPMGNLSLKLYGPNPVLNYYETSKGIAVGNTSNVVTFAYRTGLPLKLTLESGSMMSFDIDSKNGTVFNGSGSTGSYLIQLPSGEYSLRLYNGTAAYNYSFYNLPNCMGYENLSFFPGKQYYTYDGLNISASNVVINETKVVQSQQDMVYYSPSNCQGQNISGLVSLDEEIMASLSAINRSINQTSQKQDYSSFLSEVDSTASMLYRMNASSAQPSMSLSAEGLNVYSYSSSKGFVKDSLILAGNSGTVNISYGNKSVSLFISRQPSANPFMAFESGIIKVMEYMPSTFMAFLGGL